MATLKFVLINTTNGPVQGDQRSSLLGRNYFNFQSIPYMKAPIGKLRFRDPQPPEKWTIPIDATKEPPSYCDQDFVTQQPKGQEDAGIINVYTPYLKTNNPLPVMVWIHGGGFNKGSSETLIYGPDYFMQKDVVLVTFNYRIGPIGFLSLKDRDLGVPGNAGLKDQVMALKWVQENIEKFGGDPNNVTLFGESAGGASVHFHMVSELSKGLFHKAIPMSGTSLIKTWTFTPRNHFAERLANELGWNGEGGKRGMLEFLESVDAMDLSTRAQLIQNTLEVLGEHILFSFSPVIEPYESENTFLSSDTFELAKTAWSNDITCMIGGNSLEGALMAMFPQLPKFPEILENSNYLVPAREFGLDINHTKVTEYGQKLKEFYFGDKSISMETLYQYYLYASDLHFWYGIYSAVRARMNSNGKGKTYLYRFDVDLELNFLKKMTGTTFPGAAHGDDILYIFASHMEFVKKPAIESPEFKMIIQMVNLLYNFAVTGDPNYDGTEWEPLTSAEDLKCFNIANDGSRMIPLPEAKRLKIWDEMFAELSNFKNLLAKM